MKVKKRVNSTHEIIPSFKTKLGATKEIHGEIMLLLDGGMVVLYYLIVQTHQNQNLNGDITHMRPMDGLVVTTVSWFLKVQILVL